MTLDLSQFENADEGSFNVRQQNGEEMMIDGKPVVITMYGLGSPTQVRAQYKLTRENNANQVSMLTGRQARNAEDEAFKRHAEYLATCTKSIENWPFEGGVLAIYLNHRLSYVTEQADAFGKNAANFMRPATPSSASTSDIQPG